MSFEYMGIRAERRYPKEDLAIISPTGHGIAAGRVGDAAKWAVNPCEEVI
jgi:hypothetical protein